MMVGVTEVQRGSAGHLLVPSWVPQNNSASHLASRASVEWEEARPCSTCGALVRSITFTYPLSMRLAAWDWNGRRGSITPGFGREQGLPPIPLISPRAATMECRSWGDWRA